MPKRKHADVAGSPGPAPDRRKKQCAQRIAAAQKSLVAALRHATNLERQKHSRRKKTAQAKTDTKTLARLDAEYAHVKSLELEKVAEQHLRKTIGKVKILRESGCMPDNVNDVEKGSSDPALLNVKGRLFKVDAVRKVVDEVIDELKEMVGSKAGIAKAEEKGEKRKKAKLQDESKDTEALDGAYDSDAFAALDSLIAAPSSAEDDSEASLSDGHRPPSEEDGESEGDDEEELSDAESVEDHDEGLAFHNFSTEENSEDASDSDPEQDGSLSDDEPSISIPKAKRKAVDLKPTGDSKFLPTLSHPTYISGSESEASDIEAPPRKNRRGQKARQKIWEQKYKDKAKHLAKQERDKGWDAKRGAVGERGGRGGRGGARVMVGRGPEKTGANEMPLGAKKPKRDDAGSLHPSWQAAKAAKEKKMDMKPMGKKVVFD